MGRPPPLSAPPPRAPLQGLVCFVCREEGHPVRPKVGVEIRRLVEAPAAHLAAQVAVAVLAFVAVRMRLVVGVRV